MSRTKISRRAALGVIGRTGAALGTGTYFFLSLKTSPLFGFSDAGTTQDPKLAQTVRPKPFSRVAEKVVISGAGSALTVKISGPPGRHFGIMYATTDHKDHYQPVPNAQGLIGQSGVDTIMIDTKGLPSGQVFLRVVTGASPDFTAGLRGTQAFAVTVVKGAIGRFIGVRERPLESTATAAVSAASAAAGKSR